jgi:transcription initiation factor IIF auxiliary subunit
MTVRIEQGFQYQGDDWWKWWIWLEGSPQELDRIDHVVYRLHPTFPNPVRTVRDRASKFRLDAIGWGVFTIRAQVVDKDGTTTRLEHDLVLEYPDGTPTTA